MDEQQFRDNAGGAKMAEQAAAAAERMRSDSDSGHRSLLNNAVHQAVGMLWTSDSSTRNQAERCITEFAKSVPLFVGSRWGAAAAGVAFGLDEVKSGDSLKMQSAEFLAGGAKGYLTKRTFDVLGARDWGFAQKGIAMGGASRLIDTALTPQTYISNGELSITHGLSQALANAGDGKAMAADALTFGVAHFVPGALSTGRAGGSLLAGSLTGATFGFTSGALGELQQEWRQNKNLDLSKVLFAAGTEAATMGAAAATGHALTPRPTAIARSNATIEKSGMDNTTDKTGRENTTEQLPLESQQPPTKEKTGYVGYFLSPESMTRVREGLTINGQNVPLRWTPPERLHVTEQFGVKQSEGEKWAKNPAGKPQVIRVLGLGVDNTGVEALHVSVDGQTIREDGKPYHVTRSLAEGRKPVDSIETLENALAADKARAAGIAPVEDAARYSYYALAPHEQFNLSFEPRFRESDTTAPKPKPEPKPELPFEQLTPRMQVKAALRATAPDYLDRTIATRTPEHRAGSYFDMTPEKLKQELYKADWQPFNPLDGNGAPLISEEARGYRATISGGRLGMVPIGDIPDTADLYLIDPKGIGNWSVSTIGASEPVTDSVTMIVGPDDAGKPTMWTFHPGDPVRPSVLDTARLNSILSTAGINTAELPENGAGRRIPITREQLNIINSQLPADNRMTLAKIENPDNIKDPK